MSDAEATVLLLRQKLFPDPATAAAAAQSAKQSRQSKHSKTAAGPSKATAAAITAAAAAAAAAKSLPPILTKSQLYTVLTDRTAADRDLEGLRQKGRVRVFKLAIGACGMCVCVGVVWALGGVGRESGTACVLTGVASNLTGCRRSSFSLSGAPPCTASSILMLLPPLLPLSICLAAGADEYVLLLAQDYITLIDTLIHKHQQLAAQPAQQQQAAAAAGSNADNAQHHDPSTSSPAESASIAATIKLFRDRVVPAWHDATIPRSTLLQLLQSTPTPPLPTAPTAPADRAQQQQKSSCRQPQPGARAGGAVPVRSSSSQPPYERHLMAVDLMTRDSRSPDSYLLTVPGAAVFVKSVLSGRQEVLQLLARKKWVSMCVYVGWLGSICLLKGMHVRMG